jgi:membrane-bound lytic murein transglycosylase B
MRHFRLMTTALIAASAGLAACFAPAIAQSATGTISPAASSTAPLPWSGESGASGDPSMTADAIRAAAGNFHTCLESLWPLAAKRHISRATFTAATRGLAPDLRIMDLLDNQPEFTKSFWDYLDLLVSEERVEQGKAILQKNARIFDTVEKAYGVDRYTLTAFWGVETLYGTKIGDRPVLGSLATLSCIGRRQAYFRGEFLAALEIVHRGDIPADKLLGSWAGAFGPTQFMPTSFQKYAVDFDRDGHRDVVDSVPDMLASTANNLKKDGWISGEPWGYEVVVPANFDFRLADRDKWMPIRDWVKLGIVRADGRPFPRPNERAYVLIPAGVQGPGFLMLNNFRVIMQYNPAEAYALAIGHLSDRLRGGGLLVQKWPRYERVLTRAERLELQQHLVRHGYDVGEPDGQVGGRTRAAIREFQSRVGQVPDGFASAAVLDQLRRR